MSIKIEDRPQTLTQGEIENFLQAAGTAGLRASTLRRYRSDLVALQHYLGAGACIRSGTLLQWVADMHAQGYAPRSIVARVLTVNRFLQYADRPDLCQEPPHYAPRPEPSLSWPEYQKLLATAQAQGREREALLMRVFVETGIQTKTLEQITAASLAAGYFITPEAKDVVRYPKDLRRALARYAAQNGIQSGPVFLSRGNKPASRSNICTSLQRIARSAGIEPEKANPRCLQRLYGRTITQPVAAETRAVAATVTRRTGAGLAAAVPNTGQQAQAAADA